MAAASPITINTSSPQSFRIPTITPPSLQRSSKKQDYSSPQLPSPSTFVKPYAPLLKSGSRAQQAPDGVSIGFASAARLWKDSKFEVEQFSHVEDRSTTSKREKKAPSECKEPKPLDSGGKLKRPKKKANDQKHSAPRQPNAVAIEYEDHDSSKSRRNSAATSVRPNVYDLASEPLSNDPSSASKSNLNLGRYALESKTDEASVTVVDKASKSLKKPRKTATKSAAKNAEGDETTVTKRPRKKKHKSDSIILNSDEPGATDGAILARPPASKKPQETVAPKSKEKRPKKQTPELSDSQKENVFAADQESGRDTPGINAPIAADFGVVDKQHETAEQSVYFAKPETPVRESAQAKPVNMSVESPVAIEVSPAAIQDATESACPDFTRRRRRDWTPAKDTAMFHNAGSRPQTATSEVSDTSNVPRIQFTDILGNFTYTSVTTDPTIMTDRTSTGEAVTKRRRIELADSAQTIAIPSDVPKIIPKKAKGIKQPKKKPHTITAQATSAYIPPKEVQAEDPTVSAFFAHRKDASPVAKAQDESAPDVQPTAVKPKKPRKPRAKPSKGDGADASNHVKPKKPRSKKTKMAVANEANAHLKLYSPSQATAQIKKQDFLFGTSSQLAPAESPDFIRHMQIAMQESETVRFGSGNEEGSTSLTKQEVWNVPIVPQSCLEEPQKGLWSAGARNSEGGLLHVENRNESIDIIEATATVEDQVNRGDDLASISIDPPADSKADHTSAELYALSETEVEASSEVSGPVPVELPVELSSYKPTLLQTNPVTSQDQDEWMIISSDDSSTVIQPPNLTSRPLEPSVLNVLSPQRFRSPLHPLDSNAKFAFQTSPLKATSFNQLRCVSSQTAEQSKTLKKPHGRPRKDTKPLAGTFTSPEKTHQPLEISVAGSSPPYSNLKIVRPTASQPEPRTEWLDIDDISDCDAPSTPSPPRRRATSSPPAVRPLLLSPSNSKDMQESGPAIPNGQVAKADGPQWPAIKQAIFPRITKVVKSAPRSDASSSLSWWQKILLYDPIAVEDLTAWLNDQGLRVELRKAKAKKGRKRKADAESHANEADVEWEILEQPLQPWMVQKWCEEKSICCYTIDGGWRGKRGA